MKTCGRGGDTAVVRRVDRLIALLIGSRWRTPNVRRQRDLAVFRECAARVEGANESHPPQSAAQHLYDFDCAIVTERDASTGFEFTTGMRHREPNPVGDLPHDQELGVLSAFA